MATDQLSLIFGARRPHPSRDRRRLAEGEATVKELTEPFPMSQPAISRHLKVLEGAGLISRRRAAQARPTALRPEALNEADAWIECYRAVWRDRISASTPICGSSKGAAERSVPPEPSPAALGGAVGRPAAEHQSPVLADHGFCGA